MNSRLALVPSVAPATAAATVRLVVTKTKTSVLIFVSFGVLSVDKYIGNRLNNATLFIFSYEGIHYFISCPFFAQPIGDVLPQWH